MYAPPYTCLWPYSGKVYLFEATALLFSVMHAASSFFNKIGLEMSHRSLTPFGELKINLLLAHLFARKKCEDALLDRLHLATDAALHAGAAIKLVINMKKKNVVHKGATDL